MKPARLIIFPIGAVWLLAWSIYAAPVSPSSSDVELVDTKPDGEDIVQSSMITPFPSGNAGADRQPDEPNFFWSGSGDDPDAGMTYWITTTVYKTALVTLTPEPSISSSSIPVISPTPPTASDPVWPLEVFQPRNWIRTVIRSRVNESNPRFRQLVQSRLGRMYSELLAQFRNSTLQPVHVILQNITRRAGDIDVIYALSTVGSSPTSQLVEPYLAVGAVGQQQRDVTRQLCHRPVNDTQDELLLCQSVVTLAEPFIRSEETSVAAAAKAGYRYWIVGAILGAVLVVILIIILVYLIGRNKQRKDRKDVGVGDSPTPTYPARFSNKQAKLVEKTRNSTDVEDDPDPWVRKARSTSKKHRPKRNRISRPQTAPERNVLRQSSSSLSAIVSRSASSTSSSIDRLDYRLSREEPVQQSRGTRRLKKKRTKTDVLAKGEDKMGKMMERPVPKPRRRTPGTSIEMETQEVTADFTERPDTPDDEKHVQQSAGPVGSLFTTDEFGWRPGSLIPSRVSVSVFSSRKVSSAPVPLESNKEGQLPVLPKRAWLSSDQIESTRPSNQVDSNSVPNPYETGNDVDSEKVDPPERPQPTKSQLRNPPLHIHSVSYPEWPSLSETDPAIELIRSIKEELKKFEPKFC